MTKMTVVINDELETKFREAIFLDKGMKRGNIHDAIEEAIELWIKEKTEEKKK
ncbi:MAG: hypothetical protein Q8O17_06705 [Candidatus Methanoperedens sp.]|nr:hypothetical protein [Candidatus Methanoperedens sp.]